jgi:hypothetical protein
MIDCAYLYLAPMRLDYYGDIQGVDIQREFGLRILILILIVPPTKIGSNTAKSTYAEGRLRQRGLAN